MKPLSQTRVSKTERCQKDYQTMRLLQVFADRKRVFQSIVSFSCW